MKPLNKIILAALIIALLGALITTLHSFLDAERWAWYDAGFKAATEIYTSTR